MISGLPKRVLDFALLWIHEYGAPQLRGRSVASSDQNEGFRMELIWSSNLILRRLFGWIPVQLNFSHKFLMFLWPPKKHAKSYWKVGNFIAYRIWTEVLASVQIRSFELLSWIWRLQIAHVRATRRATDACHIGKERVRSAGLSVQIQSDAFATERPLSILIYLIIKNRFIINIIKEIRNIIV